MPHAWAMTATNSKSSLQPTVSAVLPDGRLVEALHDPVASTTLLAINDPAGGTIIEPFLDLPSGERLVPYAATNNLISTGCVLLPSDIGDFGDKAALLGQVQAFLHRYVDLTPEFEEIAAHYVMLTWVHDAFNELGYLRLRGDYGTGKTRALMTIGSLCYKPFFASGASTVSPIFHVLDAIGGTLVFDEADLRFSDATADITKILNNGTTKGLPVLRTMANRHRELNPQAFRVFGPKLIGMRERFEDSALESRFLTEETGGRPLRADIPIQLPDSLAHEARELRNQLLAWRFAARREVAIDPSRLVADIEPRRNQTALALLSIVDDAAARDRIAAALVGEEARVLNERASSEAGTVLAALEEAFETTTKPWVKIATVTDLFNKRAERFELSLTPKRIGWVVRERLRIATSKSNGVYVVAQSQRARIAELARRHGVPMQATESA